MRDNLNAGYPVETQAPAAVATIVADQFDGWASRSMTVSAAGCFAGNLHRL
jgi:hypothetical protein